MVLLAMHVAKKTKHAQKHSIAVVRKQENKKNIFRGPIILQSGRKDLYRLVGCSGSLVPVGIKVRAKTQPNP